MGARHARNFHGRVVGARVVAVADLDTARAAAVAAECGSARVYGDPYALIEDPAVEAVVIASPDPTHADLTLACLRAGKPVLCEKPLATRSADAWTVVEAETALGKRLVQVGFMRRYDPAHVQVRAAAEAGTLGRTVLYRGFHRNQSAGGPVNDEMILVNSAIHDLDAARWLLGAEVESVHVTGANVDRSLGESTRDLQIITLTLTGGAVASIEVNISAAYGYDVGVELTGHLGSAQTGLPLRPWLNTAGHRSATVATDWLERFAEAYIIEAQAWTGTLHGKPHTGPTAWDGYATLMASEAAQESLRTGKVCRVNLPPVPSLYATAG